jgi:putative ABC transport system permease protein
MNLPLFRPYKYYVRNWRQTQTLLIINGLSIFLVTAIVSLVYAISDNQLNAFKRYQHYTELIITPDVESEIVPSLEALPSVYQVIPVPIAQIGYPLFLSGEWAFTIYGLNQAQMEELIELSGVELIGGRLPKPNTNEVVLPDLLMRAKNKSLFDSVGSDVDPEEEILLGEFQIVGILKGEARTAFADARYLSNNYEPARTLTYLLLPQPGELVALNQAANQVVQDCSSCTRNSIVAIYSYEDVRLSVRKMMEAALTALLMIQLLVIGITSLGIGALNNFYFGRRQQEYGILYAIGYRRSKIVSQTLLEIIMLQIIAWLVGLTFSYLFSLGVRILFFAPKGYTFGLTFTGFLYTLPLLMAAILFSLVPIIRKLRQLDPVLVIERGAA